MALEYFFHYSLQLHTAVDKHVPSKTVGKRNNTPWINHTLKRLHKRKQRVYNTAKKSGKEEDWEKFRQLRKKIKKKKKKKNQRGTHTGNMLEKFVWNLFNNFCEELKKGQHRHISLKTLR